jgi:glycosyltransferase 2 family protein
MGHAYHAPLTGEGVWHHQQVTTETVVIEDGVVPQRIRRPGDLVRFTVAVLTTTAVVVLGWLATSTTAGIDSDISAGVSLLPGFVVLTLNIISGLGILGLPIAIAVWLIVRKRPRQLFDALLGLLATIVVLGAASAIVSEIASPRMLIALAGSTNPNSASTTPILGGLVAFITIARIMGRRPWNVLAVIVIGSLVAVSLVSTGIAPAGVVVSLTTGWGVGLLVRYALGTPTTRPNGFEIASGLDRAGFPIIELRGVQSTSRGRRYLARTRGGDSLQVTVLDRDMEGSGLLNALWVAIRLRDDPGNGAFNMRRTLDHAALLSYAGQVAGAPQPKLLVTAEVGPDAALLAYEYVPGTLLSDADTVTEDDVVKSWRALRTLQEHQITHRALSPEHLLRDPHGDMWLLGHSGGQVAASDVARRIDVAELLCTLAMLTSVEVAVRSGRQVLGVETLARALPVLQPVALSPATRRKLRKHKGLLVKLRDALTELNPDADLEHIDFERIKPRTLIMIVVGTIAAYVLLTQLASIDVPTLFANANWWWLLVGVGLTVITFIASAWSLSGFVPEHLKLHRTVMAQLAGAFSTLVSPPTLGSVAINMRFLTKSGLNPALAAASVGVSQVVAFIVHIVLLIGFGIAAGTQADFTFDPPMPIVIGIAAALVIGLGLLAVPAVRRPVTKRVRPMLKEVVPRLVTVAQRPAKLLEGIGGMLLLNLAFIGVMWASIKAFDGELPIAVIAVVYLAGATIGQAAPTPGGIGAVEAALAAGLTAAGLDGGIAVSSVLLFRLITFWAPTIPGYWSFTMLQKKGAL